MIEDEAEDTEAVDKLLQLSQTINTDLEKYDLLRKGDFQGAQEVTVKPMYVSSGSLMQNESYKRIYKWRSYESD
jgi:hypothetical protein